MPDEQPIAATTAPEPPQRERTLQLLGAFVRMVRKQDFHWGYLDEAWPNDDAVLADLNYAARLVGEAIDGNAPRTVRRASIRTARTATTRAGFPEPLMFEPDGEDWEDPIDHALGERKYTQAEVDAMLAFVGRRVGQLRAALDESDQLARAGESVGYASAYWTLRRGVAAMLDDPIECPGCHPSGGDIYRRGDLIRQRPTGDLICIMCDRVTSSAEPPDVP